MVETINAPGIISNPLVEHQTTNKIVKKVIILNTSRIEEAVLIVEEDVVAADLRLVPPSIPSLKVLKNNTSQKSLEAVQPRSTPNCSMSSRMPYSKE